MKTILFVCPKCTECNTFNVENNVYSLDDLNNNWFICKRCFLISKIDEWRSVNKAIARLRINFETRK